MSVHIDWPTETGGVLSTTKIVNVNVTYNVPDGTLAKICLVYNQDDTLVPGTHDVSPPNTLDGDDYHIGAKFLNEKCSFRVRCTVHSAHRANSLFRFKITVNDGLQLYSDNFRTLSKISRSRKPEEYVRNVLLRSDTKSDTTDIEDPVLNEEDLISFEELSRNLFDGDLTFMGTIAHLVKEVKELRQEVSELRELIKMP
jgi:hypothetical protein